jgi:hypothetical protein
MNSRHVLAFLGVGTLLAVGLFGRGSQGPHTSKRFGDPLTWSHDALVDHAYGMFRQLTSGDNPTWERQDMGWRDECDIGLAESTCDAEPVSTPETKGVSQSTKSPASKDESSVQQEIDFHFNHSLMVPPQLQLLERDRVSTTSNQISNSTPEQLPNLLQTIYYNGSAAFTITSNAMNKAEALGERLTELEGRNSTLQDLRVTDFPPDATVVKTFWETVTPYQSPSQPGLHLGWQVDLFHKGLKPNDDGTYNPLTLLNLDPYRSLIDLDQQKECKRRTLQLSDPNLSGSFLVFSLGCFLSRPVTEGSLEAHSSEGGVKDDIHDPYCDATAPQHCYLILVGVHIMTRETPNWLWMTFWWTSEWWDKHPAETSVQDKWDLFSANATANNTDMVANPYLEGPTVGMNSNCLECHRHAIFRPNYGAPPPCRYMSGIAGGENRSPGDCALPGPLKQIKPEMRDLQQPACFFAGALQTHFLWTIALHSSSGAQKDACDPVRSARSPVAAVKTP